MRSGVVQQEGTGRELYEHPANEFVRDFVGKTLLFKGSIETADAAERAGVLIDGTKETVIYGRMPSAESLKIGAKVQLAVRPEDLDCLRPRCGDGVSPVQPGPARPPRGRLAGRLAEQLALSTRPGRVCRSAAPSPQARRQQRQDPQARIADELWH